MASDSSSITTLQSMEIAVASAFASCLINHPFQVLRARFQNRLALPIADRVGYKVFPPDARILLRGLTSTFYALLSTTSTQMYFKHLLHGQGHFQYFSPVIAGIISTTVTAPLESAVLRQQKKMKISINGNVFYQSLLFYREYGFRRLYLGYSMTALRTTTVGSGFAMFIPAVAHQLEDEFNLSSSLSVCVSGLIVGTIFATISQPAETLRIEQQFSADEKHPLTIRQAVTTLTKQDGLVGLFRGGSYRIPRTAPGIFIIGVVSQQLEKYFKASQVSVTM